MWPEIKERFLLGHEPCVFYKKDVHQSHKLRYFPIPLNDSFNSFALTVFAMEGPDSVST